MASLGHNRGKGWVYSERLGRLLKDTADKSVSSIVKWVLNYKHQSIMSRLRTGK